MRKYAKIIDEETKLVEIGTGTNVKFYQSIGMVNMDVEQAYNGLYYLKGFAPEKPAEVKAFDVRSQRNALLDSTDKFMIEDFPISVQDKASYKQYRQYLRDISEQTAFPNVTVMTFEEWSANIE